MRILYIVLFVVFSNLVYSQDLIFNEHNPFQVNGNSLRQITSISEDGQGGIYAVDDSSTVFRYIDEQWEYFSIPGSNNNIQEVVGNKDGDIFVTVQDEGLWVFENDTWKLINHSNSLYPENPVHGGIAWNELTETLWIGTNDGLVKYQNDSIFLYNFETVGISMIDDDILDLELDEDGSVWMIANAYSLIHFEEEIFTSIPVGWNLQLYDIVFEEIAIKFNGDIVISTLNHGLLYFDHEEFQFDENFEQSLTSLGIDFDDNIWVTDEITLWKLNEDTLHSYNEPIVPVRLFDVFVSSDNHVWLGGDDGQIIEIIQPKPIYYVSIFEYVSVCYGAFYMFSGIDIDSSGVYLDTIVQEDFSSIVTLDLIVYPEIKLTDIEIVNDDGSDNGSISIEINNGDQLFDYNWENGLDTMSISSLVAGEYCCTVTNEIGCTAVFCFTVELESAVMEKDRLEVQLIPNPVSHGDVLTIKIADFLSDDHISIYNQLNQRVYSKVSDGYITIDLAQGIYFMLIEHGNDVIVKRFIVN